MTQRFCKLVIIAGPEVGRDILLSDESVTLGRDDECQIQLKDTSLSRKHARIECKDGQYFLVDLGSRNGSYINTTLLSGTSSKALQPQDVIRLGVYDIRFEESVLPYEQNSSAPSQADDVSVTASQVDEPQMGFASRLVNVTAGKGLKYVALIGISLTVITFAIIAGTFISKNQERLGEYKKNPSQFFVELKQSFQQSSPKAQTQNAVSQKSQSSAVTASQTINSNQSVTSDSTKKSTNPASHPVESVQKQNQPSSDKEGSLRADSALPNNPALPVATPTEPLVIPLETTALKNSEEALSFTASLLIKSEPFPAHITVNQEKWGVGDLQREIKIPASGKIEVIADFALRDINDVYRVTKTLDVKKQAGTQVFTIQAPLVKVVVERLPRHSKFSFSGRYRDDPFGAVSATVTDVTYGRPFYVPYGDYNLVLTEDVALSGSTQKTEVIKYQRLLKFDNENNQFIVNIGDEDLLHFPVVIHSNPTRADVYVDNKKVGETPFNGTLQVGTNAILLKKEGYFDKELTISVPHNALYETHVDLQTSLAGELINASHEMIRAGESSGAVTKLQEALRVAGNDKERNEATFLLAKVYLGQKNYESARLNYEKVKEDEEWGLSSYLGLARLYHEQGQAQEALIHIIQVLVNITEKTPSAIKSEAQDVFKMISPVKSVVYIDSDPQGARVFLNDKRLAQDTPLILSDMGIGNFRFLFEKEGYEAYQTKENIKVGEFIMIRVKLNPARY